MLRPPSVFPAPSDLLRALRSDDERQRDSARLDLRKRFADPIGRLCKKAADEAGYAQDTRKWTERLLVWQEIRLRASPLSGDHLPDWDTLDLAELASVARFLAEAFPLAARNGAGAAAVRVRGRGSAAAPPAVSAMEVHVYFQPCEDVGGDWYVAEGATDGTLWVMVADVTGKGPGAFWLAEGLPHLWRSLAAVEVRARGRVALDLLDHLHEEIAAVFPPGVFVEAMVIVFPAEGGARAASAGAIALLRRKAGLNRLTLEQIAGPWLGLPDAGPREEQVLDFQNGDELTLASDGLTDQPTGETCRMGSQLSEMLLGGAEPLHHQLGQSLADALSRHAQRDDITFVSVRRKGP